MSELPDRWTTATVAEINRFSGRTVDPKATPDIEYELYSVPIFPTGRPELVRGKEIGSTKQAVEPNDVLVCKINPRINRVWVVGLRRNRPQIASSEWIVVRAPEFDARFLRHYFSSSAFRELIEEGVSGVGGSLTRAQPKRVATFPVPVAPASEQERIGDKLDALLARVDACRERLDRVPAILKKFREAVLEAAVSGRLTEEWRGRADLTGWNVERAADVCEKVQSGGTPKEGFEDEAGIPFLKVYNIVNQKVDFEYKPQFISEAVHRGPMSKSRTRPGDVLMNIVGPPLGKVAVVPDSYPEWNINQAITLFRPCPRISSGWLYVLLCGGANIRGIVHATRGIVGQANISLSQCRDFEFPVPPTAEQQEIVRRVGELFALADGMEAKYRTAVERVEKLTPSVLAKAFRGELVAQDPSDVPAARLLERIRAARESVGSTASSSRTRAKTSAPVKRITRRAKR